MSVSQAVIIAARLIDNGEMSEAIQLLCAIDCVAQVNPAPTQTLTPNLYPITLTLTYTLLP